jgi:hypothetical protein
MRFRWLLISAVLAVIGWSIAAHPWGWLYGLGVHPYPGPQTPWTYQLYSGFLPALTVFSLLSLLVGAWHHVNCHQDRCWRVGRHKVDGTPWCNRHHGHAREKAAASLDDVVGRLDSLLALLGEDGRHG